MNTLPIACGQPATAEAPPEPCRSINDQPALAGLVAQLLEQQQQLAPQPEFTAVDAFARSQAAPGLRPGASRYRALLPAGPPGPGQQYGFEVDLDRCSGCKACVTACHALNGLDQGETWRDVGLLVGGSSAAPAVQHVTTACHHCLEPACLAACPVNAYEKDPLTGIVKHLDDQCFGCQYCTLACPYDVPKYHAGKGIVRKCDLCSDRLAQGEPPACVEACPHQAIAIKVLDVRDVRSDAEAALFLPAAPDPRLTFPTTTYKTRRAFPRNMLPVDYFAVAPQAPHWPLVVMLVLTQLSVGAFAAALALGRLVDRELAGLVGPLNGATALVFGLVALAASTLHLGRPRYAYRALLGIGHSWMSREILAFGVFAALACGYAAATAQVAAGRLRGGEMLWLLEAAVVAAGGAAVAASVMIYATLGREYWSFTRTAVRFTLTAALLGTATVWLSAALVAIARPSPQSTALLVAALPPCAGAMAAIAAAKLAWEAAIWRHLLSPAMTPLKRSARLMGGPLANVALARYATGALGGVAMPLVLASQFADGRRTADPAALAVLTALLFVACLAGELCERYLFFAAVAAPRMPGGIR